jgi:hypothetical protein
MWWQRRREQQLADAREETLRWYERLGGQIANLPAGGDPAAKQALVDASERYNAAGGEMQRATTVKQYELARETVWEGLSYIRAARIAMGIDPGPDIPPLAAQRGVGAITQEREVDVQGHQYKASPRAQADTPYYYPGGRVQGRPVPAGWYSEPWWKTALVTGAGVFGGMMLFDMLAGGFNDHGYDQGFQEGLDYADQHGWDPGSDGSDAADPSAADASYADYSGADAGGDYSGGDYGGDYAGDFGGGDFGGGDFGGGDFF